MDFKLRGGPEYMICIWEKLFQTFIIGGNSHLQKFFRNLHIFNLILPYTNKLHLGTYQQIYLNHKPQEIPFLHR